MPRSRGAEGATNEYEKDLQCTVRVSFIPTHASLNSESSEYIP